MLACIVGLLFPGLGYLVAGRVWLAIGGFLLWLVPCVGWLLLALNGQRVPLLLVANFLFKVGMSVHAAVLASRSGPVRPTCTVAAVVLCLLPMLGLLAPASVSHALPIRQVPSGSMEPVVNPGDTVLLNRWSHDFRVGEVVTFHPPGQDDTEVIKWIAAGPGESLEIRDGVVLVNGQPSPLPFKEKSDRDTEEVKVPPGSVFTLGANLNNSADSRVYGPVPLERITGKMVGKF